MKFSMILFSTTLLSSLTCASTDSSLNPSDIKKEGMMYIKKLGSALKSELQLKMKEDKSGAAALDFCTAQATVITNKVNDTLPKYAKVRRTSLKVRNGANTPDILDKKVMEEFAASIQGKSFDPKSVKVVIEGNTTRVYKPLLTGDICLKCHGSNVSPALEKKIAAHYPEDLATGFKKGELRGVIVAEINK